MRLFFAVWPPPDALQSLLDVQSRLRQSHADVRWSARDNLHFTLRFMGEIALTGIAALQEAAGHAAAAQQPFELSVGGLGVFPQSGEPRIVWAGVEKGGVALGALVAALEKELIRSGYGRRDKPFRPHLTLGRVNGPGGMAELKSAMKSADGFQVPSWEVRSFSLVQSTLAPGGARYTCLREFPLGAGRGGW